MGMEEEEEELEEAVGGSWREPGTKARQMSPRFPPFLF